MIVWPIWIFLLTHLQLWGFKWEPPHQLPSYLSGFIT